jgi:hypothetical protein
MFVIFHWEWSKYGFCFLLFQVYHTLFMYTSLRSCQWRTKSQSFRLRFRLLSVINASCHAYFRLSDNMWRYLEGFKPPQKRNDHFFFDINICTTYWNSSQFPIENMGCLSRVLVIKMNLLVSENYLSHFPILIWQLSFRLATLFTIVRRPQEQVNHLSE